jgi:hypothetical protein
MKSSGTKLTDSNSFLFPRVYNFFVFENVKKKIVKIEEKRDACKMRKKRCKFLFKIRKLFFLESQKIESNPF